MKFLIRLITGLGTLIVLTIGVLGLFLVNLDPNDYKEVITAKVKQKTGRTLSIDGDINLAYYPWLSLNVEGLTLGNAAGFDEEPFLKTKTIKVRVKLLPLLRKELVMDTLVLHDTTINLARNADGVTNWDDLLQSEKEQGKGFSFAALVALVSGEIDVRNASIHWQDRQRGVEYQAHDIRINTSVLELDGPINLEAWLKVNASKPALSSSTHVSGIISYSDEENVLTLAPILLESKVTGKAIPDEQTTVRLTTRINVDVDEETVAIEMLDLAGFDTAVTGNIKAGSVLSGVSGIEGALDIQSKDISPLFKILGFEFFASRLAVSPDKSLNLATRFNADLKRGDIDINEFTMDALGNAISYEIHARNVKSKTPAVKGTLKAKGLNLPVLVEIASQFMGEGKESETLLSKQLAFAPKPFAVETEFDVDVKAGYANISAFSMDILGMKTTGELASKDINSDSPAMTGRLQVDGSDLPLLLSIASQFSNDATKDNRIFLQQLSTEQKDFSVETDFSFDIESNSLEISKLSLNALGVVVNGKIKNDHITSDMPVFSGELDAKGSNFPLLMLIAVRYSLQSGGSVLLPELARKLGNVKNKAFTIASRFDVDMTSGKIDVPVFDVNVFDIRFDGNIRGSREGGLEGKIAINSKRPESLLKALGQDDVAQVLRSIHMNAYVKGDVENLGLHSLSLDAIFSGKNVPDSPVTLHLLADAGINLKKKTISLENVQVSGMDLDVKGNIKVEQYKTSPEFSGQLTVEPFNLRGFMQTVNKALPITADSEVLKKVAFSSDITGSAGEVSLKNVKAEFDESKLQGSISVHSLSPLNLEFGLSIDKLNVDRYLPPTNEKKKTWVTPESVTVGVATTIPTETLKEITLRNDLAISQFVIFGVKLSDIEFSIHADKGDIRLVPITAKLYGGTYEGAMHLNATGKAPELIMNTKMIGIQIEPLLKDISGSADVSGTASIEWELNSSGVSADMLKSGLSGKGDIQLTNGVFRGISVPRILKQIEIMYESKRIHPVEKGGETLFDSLTATLDIHNGIVDNRDMVMLAPGFTVQGEGMMMNLKDETWKYNMTVMVDPTSDIQGDERYNLGGYDLLIQCRGKVVDKKCFPDIESVISALLKNSVEKEIRKKLEDVIGIKLPDSTSEKSAPKDMLSTEDRTQTKTDQKQQKRQQLKDPLQDMGEKAVKSVLDRLF